MAALHSVGVRPVDGTRAGGLTATALSWQAAPVRRQASMTPLSAMRMPLDVPSRGSAAGRAGHQADAASQSRQDVAEVLGRVDAGHPAAAEDGVGDRGALASGVGTAEVRRADRSRSRSPGARWRVGARRDRRADRTLPQEAGARRCRWVGNADSLSGIGQPSDGFRRMQPGARRSASTSPPPGRRGCLRTRSARRRGPRPARGR